MITTRTEFLRSGTYDLKNVYVFSAQLPNIQLVDISAKHEAVHDSLVDETEYGRLMLDLTEGIHSKKEGASDALANLIKHSREVHEGAATYISLTMHRREDLIFKLPQYYQDAANIVGLALITINSRLIRCAIALSLAKASMFPLFTSEQRKRYNNDLSVLDDLTPPNETFLVICSALIMADTNRILRHFKNSFENKILQCEDYTALIELVGDINTAEDILTIIASIADEVTDELLENKLPHLGEMKSNYRLMKAAVLAETTNSFIDKMAPTTSGGVKLYSSEYKAVIKAFRERVKIYDNAVPPQINICKNDPELLMKIMEGNLSVLGCIYGYCSINKTDSKIFIVDTPRFTGKIAAYDLTVSEAESIGTMNHPKIIFSDEDTYLWMFSRLELEKFKALGQLTQLYFAVSEPGLPFLHRHLKSLKSTVKVNNFHMQYAGTNIGQGVNLVLYEVHCHGIQAIFFHLCTNQFAAGLRMYIERVSPFSDSLTWEPTNNVSEEVRSNLSMLVDHPLYNYYLLNSSPTVLDRFDLDGKSQ